MEEQIKVIMGRLFGLKEVNQDLSQSNCEKWDSMNHLNLITELEIEFGCDLEPEEIAEMRDYQKVVEVIKLKIG